MSPPVSGEPELGSGTRRVAGRLARAGPWTVVAVGVALSVLTVEYFFVSLADGPLPVLVVEITLLLGLAYAVAYGGYWLSETDLDPAVSLRVAAWCLSGLVGTGAVATWVLVNQLWKGVAVENPAAFALAMLSAGAAAGVLVGVKEVRARRRAAAATERGHDLVVLNELLRHHVLNGVNVVMGDAERLRGHVDGEGLATVEDIEARGERIARLVYDLRAFTSSLSGESDPAPVDAATVLRREAESARDLYPDLAVEVDAPDHQLVAADDALGAAFEHLFRVAAQGSTDPAPRVRAALDRDGDRVRVGFAADGLALQTPPGRNPFDPETRADQSLGLCLIQSLVDGYGGDLCHRADDGTTRLVVELPHGARPDPARGRGEP